MAEDARIDRECEVFCRYLTGSPPNDYVRRKYRHAHAVGSVEPAGLATRFDYFLVDLARNSTWMAQAMDSYARILAPAGA